MKNIIISPLREHVVSFLYIQKINPNACCFIVTCFSLLQTIWRNKAGVYCYCGNLRWFLTVTGPVEGYLGRKAGNLHPLKITSWFIMKEGKARRITRIFLPIRRFAHYCSSSLLAPQRMTVALRIKLLGVLTVFKQQPVKEQELAHCLFQHLPFHKIRSLYSAFWDVCFVTLTNAKVIIMASLSTTSMQVGRRRKQAISNVVHFCSKQKNNFCSVLLNIGHTWQLLTCTVFNISLANGRCYKSFCWNIKTILMIHN